MPATSRVSAPLDSVKHQNEDEALSSIISGIYDAALDAGRWCDVLAAIAGFVGGQAGGLLSKSPHKDGLSTSIIMSASIPDISRATGNAIRGPARSHACRSSSRCGSSAFRSSCPTTSTFRDNFTRSGRNRRAGSTSPISSSKSREQCCSIFSVVRDDASGMVDGEMRRRMMLVAPHIRRAALVRHAMDCQRAEIATFAATLDRLSAGLFLLDADGRIVHANAAGRDILHGDDFLRSVGGRLIARDAQVHQTLRDVCAAAGGDAAAIGLKRHRAAAGRAGRRALRGACAAAVGGDATGGGTRRRGRSSRCSSARSRWKAAAPADVIGKAFKLTPAELRVLLAIVDVGGVPEVAARSASPRARSRRISAGCSRKPAPAARPISSSWSPDFPLPLGELTSRRSAPSRSRRFDRHPQILRPRSSERMTQSPSRGGSVAAISAEAKSRPAAGPLAPARQQKR